MDEMNTQSNHSCSADVGKTCADQEKLLQMVLDLTEEVKRLSEKIEQLEQTPSQSNCILCPTIRINIPLPINIPLGNTINRRD